MLEFSHQDTWEKGDYVSYYYIFTYPDPEDSNKLVSTHTTNSCREYFIKNYRTGITKDDVLSPKVKKAYALISYGIAGVDRFAEWNTKLQDESQKGLYILNSFEKAHRWPLTKLYPVKCVNMSMPVVFFAGPRKWTMSPYLMSIWSLCIRLGRNEWLPKKLLTLNHENLVRQLCISAKSSIKHDAREVSYTLRKWDTFMSLYSKLFAGIDRKDHWSTTHLNGHGHSTEGIRRLMDGSTAYRALYDKYLKLTKVDSCLKNK
ncbi:MAG: hypothetical protein E3J47_08180 [Candidatus Stahlbacteria bacterium]|nr:MAG: hypothetical protein E3J47_08180 [Candidatus Stahlbacteria bacterium]